jgi:L-ascorbate metabolism protein UlaG (beta-lactamase superfamily)
MTHIRWYGQSAFLLTGERHRIFIDPFGEVSWLTTRGIEWHYPPITGVEADLLLVTHEHLDHNAVHVIGGDPEIIRAAGTHESPIGEVVGIASEHDPTAGTQRGANTIFRCTLDDVRIAHLGDFGQPALRLEQRDALGTPDVLFVPVGGGATLPPQDAARLVREVGPRLVVPMHYRTDLINFLEPPDAFLDALGVDVTRQSASELSVEDHLGSELVVALLEPPRA